MTKPKTKSAAPKGAAKIDPFKTRKARTEVADANDTVTPPEEVAAAIDAFREAQDQAKHFEGEATVQKDRVLEFCDSEFTKRALNGQNKSFKVLGAETMVTYVVMDSSAGLTDEDLAEFAERWGEEAAEELIMRDYGSVKFDPKVLEANYDTVVEALQSLPPEVLENLFKPMLMKAKPGALEIAKRFAKKPDDLRELVRQLKLKNYIR